ncbi:MAG: ATP-binding protein [archaeon]
MDKENIRNAVLSSNDLFKTKDRGFTRDILDNIKEIIDNPITVIITGHRRAGKSTLFLQIADKFFPNNYYYLDFSDPSLKNFDIYDYDSLYEIFLKEFGKKKAFFFDEIQGKVDWNKFVNILRERGHKCFVTGSNAEMLSTEISTFLTGRHLDRIVFPFSYKEFVRYNKIDYNEKSTSNSAKLLNLFDIYIKEGGFPEVIVYKQKELLKTIYKDVIIKDVALRLDIKNLSELENLAYYLVSHATNEYTYNSLKEYTKLDHKTIKKYIDYLSKTFLLYELTQFKYSLKKQNTRIKKIYCIDNGFLTNVGYAFSIGITRYLENLIFIELKRRGKEVYFYRDEKNIECDFLIIENKRVSQTIQVCYELKEKDTYSRETEGLLSAMNKFKLNEGLIITYNTSKTITINKKKIKFIAAYKWLLEQD